MPDWWDKITDGIGDAGGATWDQIAPGWVKDLKALAGLSALGVELTHDPKGFFIAFLLETLIGWALDLAGTIASNILDVWILFVDIVVRSSAAAVEPFGLAGDLVVDLINVVGNLIYVASLSLGPFAPFAAVGLWSLLFIAMAWAVRRSLRHLPRLLGWVIPWL